MELVGAPMGPKVEEPSSVQVPTTIRNSELLYIDVYVNMYM